MKQFVGQYPPVLRTAPRQRRMQMDLPPPDVGPGNRIAHAVAQPG